MLPRNLSPHTDRLAGQLLVGSLFVLNSSAPKGKELKYARMERERRFLLSAVPDGTVVRTVRIADRYLNGARLRLRQMVEMSADDDIVGMEYKLTQKVPAHGGGPGLITTVYLNAAEHAALTQVPAAELNKTRLSIPPLGVDVFDGRLAGLVLCEAEFDDDESMARFVAPPDAVAEVTHDRYLTGGRLTDMARSELAAVLGGYGIWIHAE